MSGQALFFLIGANFLGGASYVATAYGLRGFSPVELNFWRQFFCALIFLPLLSRQALRRLEAEDWKRILLVGLLGLAAPLALGTVGQKYSSATNAALLISFEPISIFVFSTLLLGERLTFVKAAAIAAGVAGSALIVLQGFSIRVTPHFHGDLLLLGSAVMWSIYSVVAKTALKRMPPVVFTALTTLASLPPLALASGIGTRAPWSAPPPAAAALAFLTVGMALGVYFWNRALELVPASQLAPFVFLQPVVGVVLGVLVQRDAFTVWSAAGGLVIVTAVYGAARAEEPA